jgi:hypothetical protein
MDLAVAERAQCDKYIFVLSYLFVKKKIFILGQSREKNLNHLYTDSLGFF